MGQDRLSAEQLTSQVKDMNVSPNSCQSSWLWHCSNSLGKKDPPIQPPHPPFKFSLWQWFPQLTMDSEVSQLKNLKSG